MSVSDRSIFALKNAKVGKMEFRNSTTNCSMVINCVAVAVYDIQAKRCVLKADLFQFLGVSYRQYGTFFMLEKPL
jgi:hypothetical protein